MKHKIKNLTNSPYTLKSVDGAITVPARGEIEEEFDAHNLAAIKQIGYFRVESGGDPKIESAMGETMYTHSETSDKPQAKRGRPRKES